MYQIYETLLATRSSEYDFEVNPLIIKSCCTKEEDDEEHMMFCHYPKMDCIPPPPCVSVGDPGDMFVLCPKYYAFKLKPLMFPVPSLQKVYFTMGAVIK